MDKSKALSEGAFNQLNLSIGLTIGFLASAAITGLSETPFPWYGYLVAAFVTMLIGIVVAVIIAAVAVRISDKR